MKDEKQASLLLDKWDELRAQNQEITPEELCRAFPDLLPAVKQKIEAIKAVEEKFSDAGSTADDITVDYVPGERPSDLPQFAGRYQIQHEIARGGMGAVLRAVDPDFDRPLAVKIILGAPGQQPELETRFFEEARITGRLQHPGVAPVHEIGRLEDGRPFFAMKLIEGRTLSAMLKERAGEDLPRFLHIFEQICQTLAYAHSRSVIHRDLKPANIMVGAFGEVQVMDWGLAKVVSGQWSVVSGSEETIQAAIEAVPPDQPQTTDQEPRTRAGVAMGTPAYMPPEQARGEIDQLDERCDVFGLGAILCVILTGKPPYFSKVSGQVLRMAHEGDLAEALARLENCDADLELIALCTKCLAPKKEDRPREAGEVAAAVSAYQDGVQEKLRRAELEQAQARVKVAEERKRRRLTVLVAAALLLFVVAVAGGVFVYQNVQSHHAAQKDLRQALREQQIESAINKGKELRGKLVTRLKKEGGVFDLLNAPLDWQGQIEAARSVLQRARDLQTGSERKVNPELQRRIGDLQKQLDKDEDERQLALDLDRVRLKRSAIAQSKYIDKLALDQYPDLFRRAELDLVNDEPQELARRIRQCAIREQLVAALDDWALVIWERTGKLPRRWLETARMADRHPWRDQIRDPQTWTNREIVFKLAAQLRAQPHALAKMSPQTLHLVASLLSRDIKKKAEVDWLRRVQALHPGDFWLNLSLAHALLQSNTLEALGFYRAALALRPNSSGIYLNLSYAQAAQKDLPGAIESLRKGIALNRNYAPAYANLGNALSMQKDLPGAIDAYKKALAIDPKYADAYYNFGNVLRDKKDLDGAIEQYEKAIKFDREFVAAYYNLGLTLQDNKDLRGAIKNYKKVVALDPKDAKAYNDIGNALFSLGDLPGAVDYCRKSVARNPKYARAYNNLANALYGQEDFAGAIENYRKAIALDPEFAIYNANLALPLRDAGRFADAITALDDALRRMPAGHSLRPGIIRLRQSCQRLQALAKRLASVDDNTPATEAVSMADLCHRYLKRYRDAAGLYTNVFVKQPQLAAIFRYNAACAAVLAAAGNGKDASKIDVAARAKLRDQALDWLQADLQKYRQLVHKKPLAAVAVQDRLRGWKAVPDLAAVREVKPLTALPETERIAWQKLWTHVETLRKELRASYRETILNGSLTNAKRERAREVKLIGGKTYSIEMRSKQFDTLLRLHDADGKKIAENDDIANGKNLNSRIIVQLKNAGTYRIIASSYRQNGRGAYEIIIREFAATKKN